MTNDERNAQRKARRERMSRTAMSRKYGRDSGRYSVKLSDCDKFPEMNRRTAIEREISSY